jgi:hypothetical protein
MTNPEEQNFAFIKGVQGFVTLDAFDYTVTFNYIPERLLLSGLCSLFLFVFDLPEGVSDWQPTKIQFQAWIKRLTVVIDQNAWWADLLSG